MKLIDLLVALTVSEDKMYPLIQAYVWKKIGKEEHLLKQVRCACSSGVLVLVVFFVMTCFSCTGFAQFYYNGHD